MLCTDALAKYFGIAIDWGELRYNKNNRKGYRAALQKADQHDYAEIIEFIKSRSKKIN